MRKPLIALALAAVALIAPAATADAVPLTRPTCYSHGVKVPCQHHTLKPCLFSHSQRARWTCQSAHSLDLTRAAQKRTWKRNR